MSPIKSLILLHENFEISKTVVNIECCQNQNTKTLQQNITNSKNKLLSKDEIIKTLKNNQTDLFEKSKSHAITRKSSYGQTPLQPQIAA